MKREAAVSYDKRLIEASLELSWRHRRHGDGDDGRQNNVVTQPGGA